MNNYKFRFRSRDWTQFDEADFMKYMEEAKAQGVSPEEFLNKVGMSRDEVVEYLQHRTDTDPELAESLYFAALLMNYGFEWSEAWHMIKEWDHFSEWLVENYDGPEQEIPEDLLEQDPDEFIEWVRENYEFPEDMGFMM